MRSGSFRAQRVIRAYLFCLLVINFLWWMRDSPVAPLLRHISPPQVVITLAGARSGTRIRHNHVETPSLLQSGRRRVEYLIKRCRERQDSERRKAKAGERRSAQADLAKKERQEVVGLLFRTESYNIITEVPPRREEYGVRGTCKVVSEEARSFGARLGDGRGLFGKPPQPEEPITDHSCLFSEFCRSKGGLSPLMNQSQSTRKFVVTLYLHHESVL